jgi:hypothetical protein
MDGFPNFIDVDYNEPKHFPLTNIPYPKVCL